MRRALDAIHRQVRARPHHPAVVDGREAISYRQLWSRAGAVAAELRRHGAADGPVAVAAERGAAFVGAALGCWLAGAAYLPLETAQPVRRLRGIVADAGASVVVVSPDRLGFGAELGLAEIAPSAEPGYLPPPRTAGRCAYLLYTSGTSGTPKGVSVGHDSLANLVDWHLRTYRISHGDRTLHTAGLGFDAAAWEIWPTLAAGATLVTCRGDDRLVADFIADQIVEDRCTTAFVATALVEELLTLGFEPPSLRLLLTGGDALRLTAPVTGPYRLVNHYGPTEATVVTTAHPVPPDASVGSSPPIGRPIDGVAVAVLDEGLRPAVEGELYIGGRGLALGYVNAPELTRARFVPLPGRPGRWYRSGDVVRTRDGLLEFVRRVDRGQLKVRGVRIAAAEVETALTGHRAVRGACAVVVGHGADAALVAVVAAAGRVDVDELRRHARARLPASVVPNRIVLVERLPLTPNGKLDRAAATRLAKAPRTDRA
ncbi:amino acid adenylation domain-containing protein [Streptomyces sp. NBRC 109706]|uniref:amino acid adenylation domain-containing protein n=1 Tax=Streptomyces sp. NBRC 109706 TaxID=1550035 RepID=UPI000783A28A|nr:amino acid adenylation domain-containing protein [Streptomyces sp. NBRC 109706]